MPTVYQNIEPPTDHRRYPFTFLLAIWISIIAGFWVFDTLNLHPLPTSDIGQWIMYSRYYSGLPIPSYRVPLGVSPLIPIAITILSKILRDPIIASEVLAGIEIALLIILSYLIVRKLFEDTIAAVLAAFCIGFGQYLYTYTISFGGLPQISGIICIFICYFGLSRIYHRFEDRAGWFLASLGCILITISHFPSAPLMFIVTFISLLFLRFYHKIGLKVYLRRLAIFGLVPVVTWFIYFIVFYDQLIEYATNEAGYYRRGVETIIPALFGYSNNFWVLTFFIFGMLSLIYIFTFGIVRNHKKNIGSTGLIGIWYLTPIAFIILISIFNIGTEYVRLLLFCVGALCFSLSYLISLLFSQVFNVQKGQSDAFNLKQKSLHLIYLLSLISICATIIFNTLFTVFFFPRSVSFFSIKKPGSLLEAISFLSKLPDKDTILASFLDAMWIEGLTGRGTIFLNQFRFLYRPGEYERALAAELLQTGSDFQVENGYLFLLIQQNPDGTPLNPNISTYIRGEYVDIFTLQDNLIDITVDKYQEVYKLNLEDDFRSSSRDCLPEELSYCQFIVFYRAKEEALDVSVKKTITIFTNDPTTIIDFSIISGGNLKIDKVEMPFADPIIFSRIRVPNASEMNTINLSAVKQISSQDGMKITRIEDDYSPFSVVVNISSDSLFQTIDQLPTKQPYLITELRSTPTDELKFRITITPQSQDRRETGHLLASSSRDQILKQYNVGYLLLPKENLYAINVYNDYGYQIIFQNADYLLFSVPFK